MFSFGWVELLVPFAREANPVAQACGVVAVYFAAAIQITSLFKSRTSGQPRVFRPQSGLTRSRSVGMAPSALRSRPAASSTLGIRGEWMS